MNVVKIPPDELWALGAYYFVSFISSMMIIGVMIFLFRQLRRRSGKALSAGFGVFLILLPIPVWLVYVITTIGDAYAVTSLDTEDDSVAERVYYSNFNVDLKSAIKLAVNGKQSGNVRFYASCRIADLLATNSEAMKAFALEKIASAPRFQTGFFNTNGLTCGFFVPNYAEGPFAVEEIVEKRLSKLDHSKKTANGQKAY